MPESLRSLSCLKCRSQIFLIRLEHAFVIDTQCGVLICFAGNTIAGNQEVNVGSHKAAERVFWSADNRFTSDVEAGID
jgi:hypothetical protein